MTTRDAFLAAVESADPAAVRAAAGALLAERRDSATVELVARKVRDQPGLKSFRLGLLASFTIFPVVPYLTVALFQEGMRLDPVVVEYDRWSEALSAPGGLDGVDMVAVFLHLEDVAPLLANRHLAVSAEDLDAEASALLSELAGALDAFRRRSPARIALTTLVAARRGVERHFDRRTVSGRQRRIDELNHAVSRLALDRVGVYVYDYAQLVSDHGRLDWFDPVKAHHRKLALTPRALDRLGRDFSEFLAASLQPRSKVVVVDLDNTLWGGVVGEDGPDGVAVGGDYPGNAFADFQAFLANLRATGVMLAVASKNDEPDVAEVFQGKPFLPLKLDHFTARRINWRAKADNIRDITAEIGVGVDSIVFADDDPLECDLVSAALPDARVVRMDGPASLFPARLMSGTRLYSVALTEEDRGRVQSYTAERHRREGMAGGDPGAVLARLELKLTFRAPRPKECERVAQLYAKTNQFNLTTRRLSLAEVIAAAENPGTALRIARLSDRYGDYGIIGVVLRQDAVIEDLLLSCRALGRKVEDVILAEVERETRAEGRVRLLGKYRPTAKNGLVADFYPARGFVASGDGNFVRDLAGMSPLPFPSHITIIRNDA